LLLTLELDIARSCLRCAPHAASSAPGSRASAPAAIVARVNAPPPEYGLPDTAHRRQHARVKPWFLQFNHPILSNLVLIELNGNLSASRRDVASKIGPYPVEAVPLGRAPHDAPLSAGGRALGLQSRARRQARERGDTRRRVPGAYIRQLLPQLERCLTQENTVHTLNTP